MRINLGQINTPRKKNKKKQKSTVKYSIYKTDRFRLLIHHEDRSRLTKQKREMRTSQGKACTKHAFAITIPHSQCEPSSAVDLLSLLPLASSSSQQRTSPSLSNQKPSDPIEPTKSIKPTKPADQQADQKQPDQNNDTKTNDLTATRAAAASPFVILGHPCDTKAASAAQDLMDAMAAKTKEKPTVKLAFKDFPAIAFRADCDLNRPSCTEAEPIPSPTRQKYIQPVLDWIKPYNDREYCTWNLDVHSFPEGSSGFAGELVLLDNKPSKNVEDFYPYTVALQHFLSKRGIKVSIAKGTTDPTRWSRNANNLELAPVMTGVFLLEFNESNIAERQKKICKEIVAFFALTPPPSSTAANSFDRNHHRVDRGDRGDWKSVPLPKKSRKSLKPRRPSKSVLSSSTMTTDADAATNQTAITNQITNETTNQASSQAPSTAAKITTSPTTTPSSTTTASPPTSSSAISSTPTNVNATPALPAVVDNKSS